MKPYDQATDELRLNMVDKAVGEVELEDVPDELKDWDGDIYVGVHAKFSTLPEAIAFSHAAEDLINKMNGEFQDAEMEPQ